MAVNQHRHPRSLLMHATGIHSRALAVVRRVVALVTRCCIRAGRNLRIFQDQKKYASEEIDGRVLHSAGIARFGFGAIFGCWASRCFCRARPCCQHMVGVACLEVVALCVRMPSECLYFLRRFHTDPA